MPGSLNRRDFLKLLLLAPLVGAAPRWMGEAAPKVQSPKSPNVLVVVFDTVSAKHMSLYGYPRETTPNLARLASRATVFHRHYAGGTFTSPGTASLLTGAYPWTQRAFNLDGTVTNDYARKNLFRVFAEAGYYRVVYTHNRFVVELIEQFRNDMSYWKPMRDLCLMNVELSDRFAARDYDVAHLAEELMTGRSSYGTGSLFMSMAVQARRSTDRRALLSEYQSLFPRGLPEYSDTTLFRLEDVIDWIESELGQAPRPFFGYFHLLPPHEPYNPRREFVGRFDGDTYSEVTKPEHPLGESLMGSGMDTARRQYDEYLAYADAEFGRLYDFLSSSGILDDTVVVFTSDHGQMLERGTNGHVTPLVYEGITRIPLMISKPGQTARIDVQTPTSALDVLPTLAQMIGQPVPDWCEGQPLPTFGGPANAQRPVFTVEAKDNAKQAPLTKTTVSMVIDDYKLIHYLGYPKGYKNVFELYNLKDDPEELVDLYTSEASVAGDLAQELTRKLEQVNRPRGRA